MFNDFLKKAEKRIRKIIETKKLSSEEEEELLQAIHYIYWASEKFEMEKSQTSKLLEEITNLINKNKKVF